MPRTALTPDSPLGPYPEFPIAADSADITFADADPVNKNSAPFGTAARLLVLVRNTHATDPETVTITSAPDGLNRTGDIPAYSIAAGDFAAFVLSRGGWRQSDGSLYLEASAADIEIAVIQL